MAYLYSIAFYNLENLFDTGDDPKTLDDDFTPEGKLRWDGARYKNKLNKLSRVISKIGKNDTQGPPSILAVAEVENKTVLKDLVNTKKLKEYDYGFVHYDSPDERSIDCALLFRKAHFQVVESQPFTLYTESEPGIRDYTRDILYVKGELMGTMVHILVNHWPSRGKGTEETKHKRIAAAEKNAKLLMTSFLMTQAHVS